MMNKKKSFLLYVDQKGLFDKLPDEIAGKLIKHIFCFCENNSEEIDHEDFLINIAFESIKQSLKRDFEKWEKNTKMCVKAGKASAASRKKARNKMVNKGASDEIKIIKQNKINKEKDMSSQLDPAVQIFEYWKLVMHRTNSTVFNEKRKSAVKARLKEGYTVDQIKSAIDGCSKDDWSMGKNDRGKAFNDLELICRDGVKIENFTQQTNEDLKNEYNQNNKTDNRSRGKRVFDKITEIENRARQERLARESRQGMGS